MTETQALILLVDDNEAKRYLMGTWLRRAGHTVIEAGTGRDALNRAGSAELVLLDVNLPDMTGYEACKLIKGDPATAAIPVVQISATAVQVSDRALGLTQGADAYLTDPSEPEELLAVVMAALRYSRARQRAERTASLLSALTGVALDISAAGTFDGLARAAAAGAARIFAVQAVLIVQMPDGQIRRTSASPGQAGTQQRGAPRGLAEQVTARVLGNGPGDQASAAVTLSGADWLELVPDSTLRCDVCVAAMRPKTDRPPVTMAVEAAGVPGDEELQILRQLVQLVAQAADALRSYAEEHTIALTLQRSLLPSGPPEIPGLAMSFRYIPASDQAEVGGDLPPLLVTGPDASYVGEGGLLLGLPMHEPHVERASLPPGGTLLLMTDGLVEDRHIVLDDNLEKPRTVAQEVSGADVEAFSNQLMSAFGPREDDVAMIAIRRLAQDEVPRIGTP